MTPSLRISIVALLALVICAMLAGPARCDAPRDQYSVAAGHYTQRRWELAADEFQSFLRQYPLHEQAASARFFRAETLLQLKQYDEARREYRRYVEHFAEGKYARQAEFRVGEIGYLLADGKPARADLQGYLRKYPDDALNAQVLTYLGQLSLDAGDVDAAARHYRQGLERFPDSDLATACRFGLARALEKQGQVDEAIKLFEQLAGADGNLAADALLHLAACEYDRTDYPAALAALDRLSREFPEHNFGERATLLRGWTLFELGRYAEAAPEFQRLVEKPETAAEASYWLGLTQKKLSDWKAAAETLTAAAKAFPDCDWVDAMHFHAGDAWLLAGESKLAETQFVATLETEGSEWGDDALLGRTRIALARGDYDVVEKLVAEHDNEYPNGRLSQEFQRTLATAQINSGKLAAAIELLDALIQNDEGDAIPERRLLAQAHQRAGHNEQALEILSELSGSTTDHEVLLTRGLALVGLERYAEALPCLEKCLEQEPARSSSVLALAEACYCQLKLGDIDQARASYTRLTSEFGSDAVLVPAIQRLADLALASGEVKFASELYQRLSEERSRPAALAQGLFGLGRIAFREADYPAAADRLRELIEECPESDHVVEARLLCAAALEKSGDFDAAQGMYRQVFEGHKDSPLAARALLASARLHRKSNQIKEAQELYQWLLDRTDSVVATDMVLYELAWVLRDNDAANEAEGYFQRLHAEFPESSYWADATYRLAEQARARGDMPGAAQLLDALVASDKAGALHEYGLYLRGQIAAERQEWAQVAPAMQRLLDEHPQSELARQAEFWLAEALYRQNQWDEAAERFERLTVTALADEEWLALVALRRAQIRAQREDWDAAQEIAGKIAAAHPKFRQQYEVDYLLGRCLANGARFDDAREAYTRVTRSTTGGKSETAAMAQWMIGESYFHQKNYEAAIGAYLRVEILYAYPAWQAASLLQAGKCYELLGQHEKATELYARLVDVYPDTQFAEEAARRLSLAKKPNDNERS